MNRLIVSTLTTLAVLVSGVAIAAAPTTKAPAGDPQARVETVYTNILAAAKAAPDQATLTTAVTKELEGFVDYPAFAERTLKRTWPKLTEAQRTEFMERFKDLIIQTYAKRFKPQSAFGWSYRGDVAFRDATKAEAKVRSTIKSDKVSADVDYYMRLDADAETPTYYAYDFEIDGASMALSWRRNFEKIVETDGFPALMARIEKQIGEEKE